jgi:succinyl-diaminopimelate desuccinylase
LLRRQRFSGADCGADGAAVGTLRLEIVLRGAQAHSAAVTGRNAIHRSAAVIEAIALAGERRPVLDGCEFRESTQVVGIDGGVAPNVVPDEVTVVVGHRFAPDRDATEAEGLRSS